MQIRFYAAARAAAGVAQADIPLRALSGPTLGELIQYLGSAYSGTTHSGLSLAEVMRRCSFLVEGVRSDSDAPLTEHVRVDVLPPFAGG